MKSRTSRRTAKANKRATNNGETAERTLPLPDDPNLVAIQEMLRRQIEIEHLVETLRGYGGIFVDCACAIDLMFETQRNLHNAGSAFLRVVKKLAVIGDQNQKRKRRELARRSAARGNC